MRRLTEALFVLAMVFICAAAAAAEFSWQEPKARVLPRGDLEWAPEAFEFVAGDQVRYIDYESGDDANPGTKAQPWKHHPWDPDATGRARADMDGDTFVFKRGVIYRGSLRGGRSGTAETPIRITSDPDWGTGEAMFYGSERVTGFEKGADHEDIPEADRVWQADLDFLPRRVWMIKGGEVSRLKLARTPNWEETDPVDVRSEWWTLKNSWQEGGHKVQLDGKTYHLGIDPDNLTEDADYYEGALVWPEWGVMMGAPYATRVMKFYPERRAFAFAGPWPKTSSGRIFQNNRYYLEDKPHYLDQGGEFWFEKKGGGGTLYLRLPGDVDPNEVIIEAGSRSQLLEFENLSNVVVSGLTFRFGNVAWELHRFFFTPGILASTVSFQGAGENIQVRSNRMEHMGGGVRINVNGGTMDRIVVADNEILHVDQEGINITGPGHGQRLMHVDVLRNRLYDIGQRPARANYHLALRVNFPQTAEIAGNMIDRCYAAGIFVFGGKGSGSGGTAPFSRIIIHHNKTTRTLLGANDWGGIETWQGGPFYIYNNISGDPVGPFYWTGGTFGHAYYMDGAFKNYLFNNIAWGRENDPEARWANTAAFQEIHSYQNAVFNCTAYNFQKGSRRQKPEPGRDMFLGNVFQSISESVFRHSDVGGKDPNVHHAGEQGEHFDYYTNAYSNNVMYDVGDIIATFHAQGGDFRNLDKLQEAMAAVKALASDVGVIADRAPLRDAPNHDFRPVVGTAVEGRGVKVFVPWSLYATVGEWNFTRNNKDVAEVIDEHWYMTRYHRGRDDYEERPMYPLTAVGVEASDYESGPLEDWTVGALKLNGRDQYLTLTNQKMNEPYRFQVRNEEIVVRGRDLRSPEVWEPNFLVELYVKIEDGDDGVLVRKMDGDAGYGIDVNGEGKPVFSIAGAGRRAQVTGETVINDGEWHHVLAEASQEAGKLTIYVDGKRAGTGESLGGDVTLQNDADLYLGGTPEGENLSCSLEFARIALGTLEQARTDIEELYKWQFDGPFLRDFTGAETGESRAAGAIDLQ